MNKLLNFRGLSSKWDWVALSLIFIAGNFYVLSDKPVIKWFSLAILILAIGFILIRLIIVVPSFCSDLYKRSKVQWNGILPEAAKLAKRMGVKLDENHPIGVVPSWAGATVDKGNRRRGDRIKIGSPLIDKLDRFALKGVLAHELAHLKHHNKEYVVRMVILLFAFSGL